MADPRHIETRDLDPAEIDTSNRLRPVSEPGVESLMASIIELGLVKDEVIVRRIKRSGQLRLIAGGHRVEACRRLERMVPAKVFECTDDWAMMMEVDDNLAGGELTALDSAVFLAQRKRVYEKLHPEMAQGGFRGNQHTGNLVPDIMSMTRSTAEKFGISERHVRRMIRVGEVLGAKEVNQLRGAKKPVGLFDLMVLAKIEAAVERYDVVDMLAEGRAKNAAAARRQYAVANGTAPAPNDPVEQEFQTLLKAWSRAPAQARIRFVEQLRSEGQIYA